MMVTMIAVIAILLCSTALADFDVVPGYGHTCTLYRNAIKCWGRNDRGQLGLGHTDALYEPTDAVDLGSDFTPLELYCGVFHCCSLSTTASLRCWGNNAYGELGYEDSNNRGDESGEMGDYLKNVNMGSEFQIDQINLGNGCTCALSTDGAIRCFGGGGWGKLGLGHTDNIGNEVGEMGEALINVDLGTNFVPVRLGGSFSVMCAISSIGTAKCWGRNDFGQLGTGDESNRGDDVNEMGDYLLPIDLGTDFNVSTLVSGDNEGCALSTSQELKCWGRNGYGQLGYADSDPRWQSSSLGDNLPLIDLGTDFIIKQLSAIMHTICALSTKGEMVCWGRGGNGQLGNGDTNNYGGSNGHMGDDLTPIQIGSAFNASNVRIAKGSAGEFNCVFEEADELLLKCFGQNEYGQLGYGDIEDRGDESGEMGDALSLVDLGTFPVITTTAPTTAAPTSVPTTSPSISPTTRLPTTAAPTTMEPTKVPTVSPTAKPTAQPSAEPTVEPTRDCSVFHIDEFLMDCSDEFDAHDAHIDTLNSDVASIKDELSGHALDIGDLTGTVSKLVNATTTMNASINAINAEIQVIMEQLDRMGDYP